MIQGPLPEENLYRNRPPIPNRVKRNTLLLLESGKKTSIACVAFSIALIHQLLGQEDLSWQLHFAAVFVCIALPLHLIGLSKVDHFSPELHDFNYLHDAAPRLGALGSIGMFTVGCSALFTAWHFSGVAAMSMLVSVVIACVMLEPGSGPPQNWEDTQSHTEEEADNQLQVHDTGGDCTSAARRRHRTQSR